MKTIHVLLFVFAQLVAVSSLSAQKNGTAIPLKRVDSGLFSVAISSKHLFGRDLKPMRALAHAENYEEIDHVDTVLPETYAPTQLIRDATAAAAVGNASSYAWGEIWSGGNIQPGAQTHNYFTQIPKAVHQFSRYSGDVFAEVTGPVPVLPSATGKSNGFTHTAMIYEIAPPFQVSSAKQYTLKSEFTFDVGLLGDGLRTGTILKARSEGSIVTVKYLEDGRFWLTGVLQRTRDDAPPLPAITLDRELVPGETLTATEVVIPLFGINVSTAASPHLSAESAGLWIDFGNGIPVFTGETDESLLMADVNVKVRVRDYNQQN